MTVHTDKSSQKWMLEIFLKRSSYRASLFPLVPRSKDLGLRATQCRKVLKALGKDPMLPLQAKAWAIQIRSANVHHFLLNYFAELQESVHNSELWVAALWA